MTNITKRGITPDLDKILLGALLKNFKNIKTEQELENLLSQFLTLDERIMFKKRLAIILFLKEGKRFKNIKETLDVSGATIGFVRRGLKNPPRKERKPQKLTKKDFKEQKRKYPSYPTYKGKGRWAFLNRY